MARTTQSSSLSNAYAERMAHNRVDYIRRKLEEFPLEEIFEHFDLDPEETLLRLHTLGLVDLDYYMDDEFIDDTEVEEEEDDG